jgi:NADH-quinone oxidoreductase subunit L
MFFLVFEGEVSPYAREHAHVPEPGHGEGPFSMTSTVWALTLLAAIGGLIQIPGLWELVSDWLDPVAEPLVEPSVLQDYVISAISVAIGLAGIGVAWWIYGAHRLAIPRAAFFRRLFEHKFYFDEAYDLAFYEPASRKAVFLTQYVEQPLFLAPLGELGSSVRAASRRLSSLQTGYVREYALALAAGLAVLAIVFILVT